MLIEPTARIASGPLTSQYPSNVGADTANSAPVGAKAGAAGAYATRLMFLYYIEQKK